jgi:hypothetical protein
MIANEKESVKCEDWIPFNKGIEVNNYIIIKRRKGEFTKWDILEVESMKGDWHDLIYVLYMTYGQFKDQLDHLPNRAARYDKLDSIAVEYESKNTPYEFMLPDRTDDWYIAYVKPVIYRMDPDGSLR